MITRLVLEHFKSFRCAELQLGALTLIIGPNASGKSNVRDALRFLHGVGRGYSLSECLDGRYESGRRVWPGVRGGAEEVHRRGKLKRGRQWYPHRPSHWPTTGSALDIVSKPLGKYAMQYRIAFSVAKSGMPRVTGEALQTQRDSKDVYSTHPSAAALQSDSPGTINVWYPGRARAGKRKATLNNERPVLLQLPQEPNADAKALSWCDLLRRRLQRLRFLDLSPAVMRDYVRKEHGVLGDRGENLSAAVWQLCRKRQKRQLLLEWLQELTPHDVDDIGFFENPTGEVLLRIIEPGGREVSVRSMSDGTLRFLALATALLSAEPGQVFFIEEIENGIHPTRLFLLIQLIQQLTSKGETQVIATSHAPLTLAYLDDEARDHAIYCYRDRETGLSEVVPIMELPHIKEALDADTLDQLLSSGWMEHAT